MKSLVSHEGRHCANCATPLVGEYCHECGQSMHSVLKPMHHMVEETVETVLHIDSRIVHTLPPLFLKPGFLTLEYFAGRRVRYIAPFRLMFVLCLLCFFVLHLATSAAIERGVERQQQQTLLDRGSDFAEAASADEVRHMLDAVQRLANGLAQDGACRRQQILATNADDRVQAQSVLRGLPLQLIVVLVTHLRRSVVLRRVPVGCGGYTDDCPVLLLG